MPGIFRNLLNLFRKRRTTVQIIGVYPGRTRSYALIEVLVRGSPGLFDIGLFTQEWPTLPRNEWPVPYLPKFLNEEGTAIIGDVTIGSSDNPALREGTVRMCFFFHFPAYDLPLWTPWGQVALTPPQPRPTRLRMIRYRQPESFGRLDQD